MPRRLATSDGAAVRLWDTKTWDQVFVLSAPNNKQLTKMAALAFSHRDRRLTLASLDTSVYVWDAAPPKPRVAERAR
jgi:WD40 repeat protein